MACSSEPTKWQLEVESRLGIGTSEDYIEFMKCAPIFVSYGKPQARAFHKLRRIDVSSDVSWEEKVRSTVCLVDCSMGVTPKWGKDKLDDQDKRDKLLHLMELAEVVILIDGNEHQAFDVSVVEKIPPKRFRTSQIRSRTYLREMMGSKVCLNFRGGSPHAVRFFEILAVGGFCISDSVALIEHEWIRPPESEKHAVFCSIGRDLLRDPIDVNDLMERCKYYSNDATDEERLRIASNGWKYWALYESSLSVLAYVATAVRMFGKGYDKHEIYEKVVEEREVKGGIWE